MVLTQIETAIKIYQEKRREIYKELKIAFIQERIKRKILKQQDEHVDLLFFDSKILNEEDDKCIDEDDSSIDRISENSTETNLDNDEPIVQGTAGDATHRKSNRLCSFLDLEAEYSGEEEEEVEGDEDLAGLIDNSVDDGINLEKFVKEREEQDKNILRKLANKFSKKRKIKSTEINYENLQIDSHEEFPEINDLEEIENEVKIEEEIRNEKTVKFEFTSFKKLNLENQNLFNDEENALMKLEKKEEEKPRGYFERRN